MSAYAIRRAVAGDAAVIATHRASMFRDMDELSGPDFERFLDATTPWIAERMASGEYIGWLVEHESRVVAGGGVLLRDLWPTPWNCRAGRVAHVGSMYTEPEHRRRGIARLVMHTILEWCAAQAVDLVELRASRDGRPLYEQLGFTVDVKAMRLTRDAIAH
jgi:GNAT superfamily N-acetyltransferase